MNGIDSMRPATATLEPYEEGADESLAALSELGAFYPLITYPANDLEDEETLEPLVTAGLIAPRV